MFKVIGELINTSRKQIRSAAQDRDATYISSLARKQIEAGAHWIDVNAGARAGFEKEDMRWLLKVIQAISGDTPLSLDSDDPEILHLAFDNVQVQPLINSISLEKKRWEGLASFLKGKKCDVLALCMDDSGLPKSVDQVLERADRLVHGLNKLGFANESIYIDPLVQPVSTDVTKGKWVMEAVSRIHAGFEGIHTTCGLSNISYALPQRRVVNRYFVAMMIARGLDSAIVDPLDKELMAAVRTAEMLIGNDRFCRGYINAVRAGKIES